MEAPRIEIQKLGWTEMLANLGLMPGHTRILVRSVMRSTMEEAKRIARAKVDGPYLIVRTGDLQDAIGYKIEDSSSEIAGVLGFFNTRKPEIKMYGAAHEGGATVKPVSAQVMTIPLTAALDSRGVPKFSAWEADDIFDRTFWKESRNENLILFGVVAGELVPLFLGVEEPIKIEAKYFLRDSMTEVLPHFIQLVHDRYEASIQSILSSGIAVY